MAMYNKKKLINAHFRGVQTGWMWYNNKEVFEVGSIP